MITFQATTECTVLCTNFNITDDDIKEPAESFTVTGSGVNFVGGQNSVEIIIEDDGKDQSR